MDATLKDFLASGKALLTDTKTPRKVAAKTQKLKKEALGGPPETDPFKIFVKRVVDAKPPKKEMVAEFKRFISAAESEL